MKLSYDPVVEAIQIAAPLRSLSQREQVELFRYLLDRLGISERFAEEPDATCRAQEIMVEQWDLAWNSPAR